MCLTTQRHSPHNNIDVNNSFTENYQHHKPSGYKFCVLNSITNEIKTYLQRGRCNRPVR